MKVKLVVWMTCVVTFIASCSESDLQHNIEAPHTQSSTPNVALSMPARIVQARAIDRSAIFAEIRVNGALSVWSQNSDFSQSFSFNNGDQVNLSVMWFETLTNGTKLPLVSHVSTHTITQNTTIAVSSTDYSDDFLNDDINLSSDPDEDTYSNLVEREADSDPFDPNSIPGITPLEPDVRISWVNPTEAPVIDGLYDSIWDSAQFSDTAGERLGIDNLMIDKGADRLDGDTEFRWFALHDDTFLYIFVLGENVDRSTPFRDSTEVWQDDNINLYLDGDNSKGASYDGFDDRHILIPLLTSPNQPDSNNTIFFQGPNSADLPALEFFTCLCSAGQHTWEIKLRMADFNIVIDREFGFDVQLDDDNDGGARDAKWGWFHPSRGSTDVDNTWTTPSFMGTAIVE